MGTATLLYRCLEIPSPQMLLVLLAAFPLWHTTPEKRNPPHSTHTSTLTRAPHTQLSSPSLFHAFRCFACSLEVPLSARGHDIPYPAPNILDQRRPDQTRPDQTERHGRKVWQTHADEPDPSDDDWIYDTLLSAVGREPVVGREGGHAGDFCCRRKRRWNTRAAAPCAVGLDNQTELVARG